MNSATPPNREKEILEQALRLPSAQRLAFVRQACGTPAHVRRLRAFVFNPFRV